MATWTCVDCREPIPTPTSDPFRCPTCCERFNADVQDELHDINAEQLAKGDDFRQLLDMSDRRGIEWMHTIVRGIAAIQGRTVCR